MGMSLSSLLFPKPGIFFFQTILVPGLTPGQMVLYDAETALRPFRKFSPFSNIQVVNTSTAAIELILDYNPDRKLIVLAGGTKALRNQPIRSFSVKNTDAIISIPASGVFIELETIR